MLKKLPNYFNCVIRHTNELEMFSCSQPKQVALENFVARGGGFSLKFNVDKNFWISWRAAVTDWTNLSLKVALLARVNKVEREIVSKDLVAGYWVVEGFVKNLFITSSSVI